MRFSIVAATCVQVSAGLALPVLNNGLKDRAAVVHSSDGALLGLGARAGGGAAGEVNGNASGGAGAEDGNDSDSDDGNESDDSEDGEVAEGAEGAEGGEAENEVELEAQFDEAVALEGGDIKQDTLYPPGDNGVFEVEFQNTVGNTLTVSTNASPAAPPAGFENLEATSFIVSLADDTAGATLQKIDYILNANNTLDISQGKVGKLDAATDTFVIDDTVGELEFELEENELTLSVDDLNGEWAIFVPAAAGGGGGETGGEAGEGAGDGAETPTTGSSMLDSVLRLIGEGAAAADAEGAQSI